MQDEKRTVKLPHNVIMEDRKKLTVSGVSDVDSFDDNTVVIYTDMGELTVKGDGLHISGLNIDTGDLSLTGNIYGLMYTDDNRRKGGSFLSRLLK
ncbi:MAG: sporulation protein YabP [Firmicutes bacterium]|nr:sporulation protein YabP [Bacillota bacterium]